MSPKPIFETRYEELPVSIYGTNEELGQAAAEAAAQVIAKAIQERGEANIIIATGNSQLTFLTAMRTVPGFDWSKVNVFHMDEYVNLDPNHRASFPKFLREKLLNYVTPRQFFPVVTYGRDPEEVCREYEAQLRAHPVDLTALGIGENGHLAFNDPPYADFDDPRWVKVITLAERSRQQQFGEGHFDSIDEVPRQAITLTIPALLSAGHVLAIVPEARKAEAVGLALLGPITEDCPASILRKTPQAHLYLDRESAAEIARPS